MLPILPLELREHILQHCSTKDYKALSCCSREYKEALKHYVWRNVSIPSESLLHEDFSQDHRLEMLSYADIVCVGVTSSGNPNEGVHGSSFHLSTAKRRLKIKHEEGAHMKRRANISLALNNCNPRILHTTFLCGDPNLMSKFDRLMEIYLYWTGADDSSICSISSELRNIQSLGLKNGALSDKGLSYLYNLTNLRNLSLQNCSAVTDDGFAVLSSMKSLQELLISGCAGITREIFKHFHGLLNLKKLSIPSNHLILTNDELLHLRGLISLKELNVTFHADISDVGFFRLSSLTTIEHLRVDYCDIVTDIGLSTLRNLTSVKHLHLGGLRCPYITNMGVSHISGLSHLVSLTLDCFHRITDAGLLCLSSILSLKELFLRCRRISDIGLQHLVNLKNLEKFSVYNSRKITDRGLSFIANMSNLTEVQIGVCSKISASGIIHLSKLKRLAKVVLVALNGVKDTELQCLSDVDSLTDLHISYCANISGLGLMRASESVFNLEKLEIEDCVQVNDESLMLIGGLCNLQSLSITRNRVTDVGIKNIGNLVSLRKLDISNNKTITDEALSIIGNLLHLNVLKIGDCCRITDEGLHHLLNLDQLKELVIVRCNNITSEGIILRQFSCLTREAEYRKHTRNK